MLRVSDLEELINCLKTKCKLYEETSTKTEISTNKHINKSDKTIGSNI
jgi:hypothetical protein